MEVHHHPHVDSDSHRKKNFKEYFLEFVMIFLAVTMGFFAESIREHLGDRSKEREYLSSMVSELQYDTTQYSHLVQELTYLRPILDSLYVNAKDAKRFNYVLLGKWNTPVNEQTTTYEPSLTTIEQLKSSGNLRLIDDKIIARQIVGYAAYVQNKLLTLRSTDMNDASNNIYEQEDAISDEADFNKKIDDNIENNIPLEKSDLYDLPLLVKDSVTLNKLANSFVNLKARDYGYSGVLNHADTLATELIQSINNKYHFSNE
jgi:hypothetical protein